MVLLFGSFTFSSSFSFLSPFFPSFSSSFTYCSSFHLSPSPLPPDHSFPILLDPSSFSCSCSSSIYFLRKGLSYHHIAQSGLELNISSRIASNSEQSSCLNHVPTSAGIIAVTHHSPDIFFKFISSPFQNLCGFVTIGHIFVLKTLC